MSTVEPVVPFTTSIFEDLLEEVRGVRKDGLTTQRVHQVAVPNAVDVAALRARLGLTQAAFAARFGFGLRAVQQWEQGKRRPEGPARVLLAMTAADPQAVDALLERAGLVA